MYDDYSKEYITNLIDRLNQQIEDISTARILTTYLDFTEQEAKDALANAKFPKPYACDDNIGSVLLDEEDSGDKQEVFNVLDTDYYIYKIVMSK